MKMPILMSVLLMFSARALPAQAPRADLNARWQLNATLSDTIPAMPGPRKAPGTNVIQSEGPRSMTDDTRERIALLRALHGADDTLTISATTDSVRIGFADGVELRLATNGKTAKFPFRSLDELQVKASWKDGALVLEAKSNGVKMQELFERGVDSPRLIVTTRIAGELRTVDIRRVYDLIS